MVLPKSKIAKIVFVHNTSLQISQVSMKCQVGFPRHTDLHILGWALRDPSTTSVMVVASWIPVGDLRMLVQYLQVVVINEESSVVNMWGGVLWKK